MFGDMFLNTRRLVAKKAALSRSTRSKVVGAFDSCQIVYHEIGQFYSSNFVKSIVKNAPRMTRPTSFPKEIEVPQYDGALHACGLDRDTLGPTPEPNQQTVSFGIGKSVRACPLLLLSASFATHHIESNALHHNFHWIDTCGTERHQLVSIEKSRRGRSSRAKRSNSKRNPRAPDTF